MYDAVIYAIPGEDKSSHKRKNEKKKRRNKARKAHLMGPTIHRTNRILLHIEDGFEVLIKEN
jgi:hypothetical protein